MAVSLVPSVRYGNCCHFYPYLRPRCVWFSAVPRMHARMHVLTACTYASADWLPPHDSPPFLSSLRVWYVSWYLVALISGNFAKRAWINRARSCAQGPPCLPLSLSMHSRAFFGYRRCEETEKSYFANYLLDTCMFKIR